MMSTLKYIIFGIIFTIYAFDLQVVASREERIVGGDLVQSNTKYPSQCSLRVLNDHKCGCIILDQDHVLTAASCADPLFGNRLSAHVGSTHVNAGGQNYELSDALIHPDYISGDAASPDLAIVPLLFPFVFTPSVQPALLPIQNETVPSGSPAVIIGWGYVADSDPISPNLKEANLTIRDINECASIYAGQVSLTETKICADVPEGGTGYCNFDEGGPLFVNDVLQGVMQGTRANSASCAEVGKPDVFTRVASYVDWITTNTNRN